MILGHQVAMADDKPSSMGWTSMLGMAGMFVITICFGIFIQPAWNFEPEHTRTEEDTSHGLEQDGYTSSVPRFTPTPTEDKYQSGQPTLQPTTTRTKTPHTHNCLFALFAPFALLD